MMEVVSKISAVYLQGLWYENELNVNLSPPDDLGRDVYALAGNLGFNTSEIRYIREKNYPFVYMLDQWIKRVGAEDATLEHLHENLIELKRNDAAEIIQEAIQDLSKKELTELDLVATRHNQKLKRSESNASLCPSFPRDKLVVDLPFTNSHCKKDSFSNIVKHFKSSYQSDCDAPNVYLCYVTQDITQLKVIRKLVDKLRKSSIDAKSDMNEFNELSENQGYHIYSNLIDAEYVLVICTSSFGKKNEDSDEGRKAAFIMKLILDFIYEYGPRNMKYIPVLLPDSNGNREHVPLILRGSRIYDMSRKDHFQDLIFRVLKKEKYKLPDLPETRPELKPIDISTL